VRTEKPISDDLHQSLAMLFDMRSGRRRPQPEPSNAFARFTLQSSELEVVAHAIRVDRPPDVRDVGATCPLALHIAAINGEEFKIWILVHSSAAHRSPARKQILSRPVLFDASELSLSGEQSVRAKARVKV